VWHAEIRPEYFHAFGIPNKARDEAGWHRKDFILDAAAEEGGRPAHV
jgi:hypothetical protein